MNTEADITLEHSTTVEKNIQQQVNEYYNNKEDIEQRIVALDDEWDVERVLGLSSATLTVTGILLSTTRNRGWFALPLVASAILVSHAFSGWSPPMPLLKALGFRKRAEIDKEKFALKAIRGDFNDMLEVPNAVWSAVNK